MARRLTGVAVLAALLALAPAAHAATDATEAMIGPFKAKGGYKGLATVKLVGSEYQFALTLRRGSSTFEQTHTYRPEASATLHADRTLTRSNTSANFGAHGKYKLKWRPTSKKIG